MKKAIVTGANGFVGSHVVAELLKNNVSVIAVVHNNHTDALPKDDRIKIVSCDLDKISDLKESVDKDCADIFYHFAWTGSAGPTRSDTQLQLNDAQWTIDAIRTAKYLGCERFVCAGSIMEHETFAAAYTQGNKPGMGYVYGSGKLVAHTMAMAVAANIGIDLLWGSITNAYGVGERSPRMVNTTIRKIINNEVPKFSAGTQNYDFIYIDDLARAFYLIGKNGKPFHEYRIGSSTARPLKEFLLEMKKSIAPNLDFIFGDVPFTGIDLPLSTFDCSETERDTGFRAKISFAEGTKLTKEWLEKDGGNVK